MSSRAGTRLIEKTISSLDDAFEEANPSGLNVPLVLKLPVGIACCPGSCACLARIPSGFYPIVSQFGRFIINDEAKQDLDQEVEAGGACLPPWKTVEKLITKSVNVFEVPLDSVKTKDNVTAKLDVLIQFQIVHGRTFIEKCGADKLDLLLRAHLDEAVRTMASFKLVKELYDMQGQDEGGIVVEMDKFFRRLGVSILLFTIRSVQLKADMVAYMQAKTGFASQKNHLEADQRLKLQGLDNTMELKKLQEEGQIRRLEEEEKGQKVLSAIDIGISEIRFTSKKELALARAEYEETVQEMLNDAQLEVQDLNNQRDTVTREVEAQTGKEKNDIMADSWMYRRTQELEKVMKSAMNESAAKKAVAGAEADSAKVLEARREHEQQMKRLDVFEALSKNTQLRIASLSEVKAGANLSFTEDGFDGVVEAGVQFAKDYFQAPMQERMGGQRHR